MGLFWERIHDAALAAEIQGRDPVPPKAIFALKADGETTVVMHAAVSDDEFDPGIYSVRYDTARLTKRQAADCMGLLLLARDDLTDWSADSKLQPTDMTPSKLLNLMSAKPAITSPNVFCAILSADFGAAARC